MILRLDFTVLALAMKFIRVCWSFCWSFQVVKFGQSCRSRVVGLEVGLAFGHNTFFVSFQCGIEMSRRLQGHGLQF